MAAGSNRPDSPQAPPGHPVAVWHRIVEARDLDGLKALLDADAVFISPVVHTSFVNLSPIRLGRSGTSMSAAVRVWRARRLRAG